MPIDLVLRAIATLTCMYTAGLFITLTSIAALNASGTQFSCGPAGCLAANGLRHPPGIAIAAPIPSLGLSLIPARV